MQFTKQSSIELHVDFIEMDFTETFGKILLTKLAQIMLPPLLYTRDAKIF